MGELQPINKVAMLMNISSRTLRYWEDSGLFQSTRDAQSNWRFYDDTALQCIRITDLLRRLDISIKDIKEVINHKTVESLQRVLNKQLNKLSKMDTDLHLRKEAISELMSILDHEFTFSLSSLESILIPIAVERNKYSIEKLQGGLGMESIKSKYGEVLLIQLPPMRAAAYSHVGAEPENEAIAPVVKWIAENDLKGTMRLFGFNTEPYPSENSSEYGFGFCATIPEGIEIPKPLYEMRLPGGIYAVISQYEGDPSFGWQKVHRLMDDKDWEWEYDMSRLGLEEHIENADKKGGYLVPILFPVKKRNDLSQ